MDEAVILADVSVRYLSCGDTAFTVEFGNEISPEINGRVMALHAAIGHAVRAGSLGGVIETVPTMRSLMVTYDPMATSRAELLTPCSFVVGPRWLLMLAVVLMLMKSASNDPNATRIF